MFTREITTGNMSIELANANCFSVTICLTSSGVQNTVRLAIL